MLSKFSVEKKQPTKYSCVQSITTDDTEKKNFFTFWYKNADIFFICIKFTGARNCKCSWKLNRKREFKKILYSWKLQHYLWCLCEIRSQWNS